MVYTDNHLITLNSKYAQKNNGSMLSQCVFGFTGLLQDQDDIIASYITITNAQIPVSFYTITTTNNTLNYASGALITSFNIPIGNYNSNSLITALVSGFVASGLGTTPTITINKINGKLIISSSVYIFLKKISTISSILGFIDEVACSTDTELPYPLNLLGVKKISIKSEALSISAYSSINFATSNTLTTIPIDQPPFNMVSYINQSDMNTNILQARTLNTIDISIVDENNNFIDFNNCDWSISLCLSIHRKNEINNNIDLINFLTLVKASKKKFPDPIQTISNEIVPQSEIKDANLDKELELLLTP